MPERLGHPTAAGEPRVLVVRGVNWLGDAVMTTPLLQRLREGFPHTRILLLTSSKLADLWEGQSCIDRVVTFESGESLWSVGRRLRLENADMALVLPNSARSAMEMWLALIPKRVGYRHPWRNWALTDPVARRLDHAQMRKRTVGEIQRLVRTTKPRSTWPGSAHQVHEYLHLASALGASAEPVAPRLSVTADQVRMVAEKLGLTGSLPGARPLFGLNPGAEYGAAKRWPAERFIRAAMEVHRILNCVWLLTGGSSDVAPAHAIELALAGHGIPVVNAVGKTSLKELCALFRLCRVVLTNDTGPMHVAAAVGTPVVVPFGSTSPELTGPGMPNETRHRLLATPDIPCAPCFRRECPIDFRCMKSLGTERIVEALRSAVSAG